MKRYLTGFLAMLLACCLLLAGCGEKGGEASSKQPSGSSSQLASSGEGTTSGEGSSVMNSSGSSQTASSLPPASSKINGVQTGKDTSDAVKGKYYNNTVDPYYSKYVLVCGDYALEIFGGSGSSNYAKAVSQFAEKYPGINTYCGIIPISSAFNAPAKYENQYSLQKKAIENMYSQMSEKVKTVDILGALTPHKGEYIYYRTDHHWTSLGAYYAYTAFGNAAGFTPRALADYDTVRTEGYVGSLYTLSASPHPAILKTNPDHTIGRLPPISYTMQYERGGTWYKGTAINPKASGYMMFINGDQPLTKIETENKNGRKLMVFKESFGNAVIPYLIEHFEEIIVVDIREETPSTASLVKQYGITDALFLNYVMGASGGHVKSVQAKVAS